MNVGKSVTRVDAYEKVTGGAKYTSDLIPKNYLVAKVVHSTIANGLVKSFDLSDALKVEGVVKILTCFDCPKHKFPTAGHPWSTDVKHQDVADRCLLNQRVRFYGDDIGVIIAENQIALEQAAKKIKVEYEEYPALTTVEAAMAPEAGDIHGEYPNNILGKSSYKLGDYGYAEFLELEEKAGNELKIFTGDFKTATVQHCHLELPTSFAYMENDRIVVVSSTQIPHIVRRVIGQALGLPWGKIRVIKPYIGGGFGNKQDVLYEPLNAWLTTMVGGRAVQLEISREETFVSTRVRHAIEVKLQTAVNSKGEPVASKAAMFSNQGGYAAHGHSVVANSASSYKNLYLGKKALEVDAYTVYTNLPTGGAMRGYGIPQLVFAVESHMDDIATALNLDPIEFRLKNCMSQGYVDPITGMTCYTSGLRECLEKGKKIIGWEEKRRLYSKQTGNFRRGVGMAMFSYKAGVYPISLETSAARLILNQDGSVQLQVGATEIGQGSDTIFTQMVGETLGISLEKIHVVSTQDTDVTPFDPGAYASRQTYVCGMAVKETAAMLKTKILAYAAYMLTGIDSALTQEDLDIVADYIVQKSDGSQVMAVAEVALESFYSLNKAQHLTAEVSNQCKDNTFSFGACFAEVEVDIALGKVNILNIVNVHDSGVIINPKLAEAQVHGGMSMALGYAMGEELLFDAAGKPLNNNLLDYKLPTALDTPDLQVDFVETQDPTGPYGNKSLGEPPAIPGAPAIRNAILQATGVGINSLPLNGQKLVEHFVAAGLINKI